MVPQGELEYVCKCSPGYSGEIQFNLELCADTCISEAGVVVKIILINFSVL